MLSNDPLLEPRNPHWPAALGVLGVLLLVIAIGWAVVERVRDAQQPPPQIPGTGTAPLDQPLTNSTGTAAEAALDRISGGAIELVVHAVERSPCPEAIACVSGTSQVHISAPVSVLTDIQLRRTYGLSWDDVMLHEYAHVVQFEWRPELEQHEDYLRLFGGLDPGVELDEQLDYPIEHLADCMALSVDSGFTNAYPGVCTPEQLAFALSVWDGSFRD
jgi:hypothetical protein